MPVIKNLKDLENYILVLEAQKEIESKALMVELKNSKSNFNPVNLIGEAISKLAKNKLSNFHSNTLDGSLISKVLNRDVSLIKHYEEHFDMPMDDVELYKKIDKDDILTDDII